MSSTNPMVIRRTRHKKIKRKRKKEKRNGMNGK
jgi:hypothetical protein